jgi:hypothetical protein
MNPQRFRTTVLTRGINPYVDVPPYVSQAFEEFGRAGRIGVVGRLNGTDIRASASSGSSSSMAS